MNLKRQSCFILLIILCCSFTAQGQLFKKKKGGKKGRKVELSSDSVAIEVTDLTFKNINKVPLYRNLKELKKIEKLDKEKKWKELYPKLKEYVSNFGVLNFAYDTYYLWRLAKLTEVFSSPEQAKPLYRLVLKHHRRGLDIKNVLARYDSINRNRKDYFVPLEYYYELVEYRRQVDTLMPPRGVLTSMGNLINSVREDYAPSMAMNDNAVLFTSKRNSYHDGIKDIINEDIFISRKTEVWEEAEMFESINSQYNEGSATMTRDGKTIFFSRCGSPDSFGNCDLYFSTYQGDTLWTERERSDTLWTEPENMGGWINSTGWDSHPTLSPTEDTLYFSSDRQGGFGLADIYYTYKNSKDQWVEPQNMGPVINTRYNEVSPFFHPEHDDVLYFSSNGHLLNFGDYDIYKAYHIDDKWSEPTNIGPLVNGTGTEFYFSIDRESNDIFYSRSRQESMKNLDLYSFPLPMEGQPLATTLFSGKIEDDNGNTPANAIVSIIDLDEGVEVAPKYVREDGSFDFNLINNRNYLLVIQGDDFFRIEKLFYLEGETEYEGKIERVTSKIEFTNMEFENGKADILPAMKPDLQKVVDFLIDHPKFKVNVSGHTDSSGSADLNLQLSQDRADAIRDYVLFRGILTPDRVTAIGYGSQKPIVKNEKTEEDRRLNRRVEFEIYRDAPADTGKITKPNNGGN
ncbi:MAG: OmpA family protein [Roseivirga sp.]|nr:OmpA family protein [Roseivirga sp.]